MARQRQQPQQQEQVVVLGRQQCVCMHTQLL
jgi:hypothetical protein